MKKRLLWIAVAVLVIGAMGYWIHRHSASSAVPGSTAGGSGLRSRRGAGRGAADSGPATVDIVPVRAQNVPIYVDGLGTVQAYNTVTVQAQVSGKLISVPFKEGDEVKRGDLLAQIDPRSFKAQLDQALAKQAQDTAQLKNAEQDLQRYEGLVTSGYVSQQQLDGQRAQVAQFSAQVQADAAAVESARVQLSYTRITSPIDGRLGIRLVDVGNLVGSSGAGGIVVVTQLQPISVVFTLPEQALDQLRPAQAQSEGLRVEARSRDDQTTLAVGKLAVISNQIDQSTGTIKLKATFPNRDETLWPGQFVNVRLLVRTRQDGVVIPVAAVQRGPDGAYAYVIGADRTAQMRKIDVAQTEDNLALINSGLTPGEQVVVDGQYQLKPGAKVRVARGTPAAGGSVVHGGAAVAGAAP
ncbi:MAG: efflux RND transporter periplasmic adaptor subunit [Gammaproteobacteria bacterium]|nr:efflux RND transporter periplasmic adaptor subunit [Gammaproteobacteria bacterium]